MAGVDLFMSDIAEYIHMEGALCLSVLYHFTNYETPTASISENLRSPVISK
jgi:hypothetical protein